MLMALFREKTGHDEGRQFDMLGPDGDADAMLQPQILNPSHFLPALRRTDYFARVTAAARQLLGPYAQFSFDHSILKPAHSRTATPWHQDDAHHSHFLFRYRQISFWMPLQNTPVESGCMRYLPGSHRGPVLPHHKLNDDPRMHAMECQAGTFDATLADTQPASAGTCILHDGSTLHAALPNRSDRDRLAYIIAFIGPPQLRSKSAPRVLPKIGTERMANETRRKRWLLRGGILTAILRRARLGLRSRPGVLWLKIHLLLCAFLSLRAPSSDSNAPSDSPTHRQRKRSH